MRHGGAGGDGGLGARLRHAQGRGADAFTHRQVERLALGQRHGKGAQKGVARRRGVDHLFGGQPQGGDFDPLRCRDHQARLRAALDDDLAHPEALAPWLHCERNPYWRKLHEHIDDKAISSWCDDHDQILKALMRKDPQAAKLAMWQHLENVKQRLLEFSNVDDIDFDGYLFDSWPLDKVNA